MTIEENANELRRQGKTGDLIYLEQEVRRAEEKLRAEHGANITIVWEHAGLGWVPRIRPAEADTPIIVETKPIISLAAVLAHETFLTKRVIELEKENAELREELRGWKSWGVIDL